MCVYYVYVHNYFYNIGSMKKTTTDNAICK